MYFGRNADVDSMLRYANWKIITGPRMVETLGKKIYLVKKKTVNIQVNDVA